MSLPLAILLFLFAHGVGSAAWRLLWRGSDPAHALPGPVDRALATLLGAGLIGTVTMPLAALGLGRLPRAVLVGVVLAGAVLGVREIRAHRGRWIPAGGLWRGRTWSDRLGLLAWLAAAAVTLVLAWRPTISVDDWMYHLSVPRQWLVQGKVPRVPHEMHHHFHLLTEAWWLWSLVLASRDFLLTKLTQVAAACIGGLVLRWLGAAAFGSRGLGWVAGVWWMLAIPTIEHSASNYIDVGHGCLLLAGAGVMARAAGCDDAGVRRRLFVLSGLFLGFAVSTKVSGLAMAGLSGIALLVVLVARGRVRDTVGLLRVIACVALPAIAVHLPWVVKSVLFTGNPVYPFGLDLFGAPPDLLREAWDFQASYGGFRIADDPRWTWRFIGNAAHMDLNRAALLALATAPLWFLDGMRRHLSRSTMTAHLVVAAALVWPLAYATPVMRFVLGPMGLLFLVGLGALRVAGGRGRVALVVAWVVGALLVGRSYPRVWEFGWRMFPGRQRVPARLWLTEREAALYYHCTVLPLYGRLDEIEREVGPDGLLWITENFEIAVLLDIPLWQNAHMHGPDVLVRLAREEGLDAEAIHARLRDLGVTHLLTGIPARPPRDPAAAAEFRARGLEPLFHEPTVATFWRMRPEMLPAGDAQ
jgi:hypothetical protein